MPGVWSSVASNIGNSISVGSPVAARQAEFDIYAAGAAIGIAAADRLDRLDAARNGVFHQRQADAGLDRVAFPACVDKSYSGHAIAFVQAGSQATTAPRSS